MSSQHGKIVLSKRAHIAWALNQPGAEYWAALYVDDEIVRHEGRGISGWWRTDDVESLKTRVLALYGHLIPGGKKS